MIWPGDVPFRQCEFRINRGIKTFDSPFGGGQQQGDYGAAVWEAKVELAWLNRVQAGAVLGMLAELGRTGILLPDAPHATPLGVSGGLPVTDGENQGGVVNIKEATPAIPGWLKAGDLIQISNAMYLLTQDADTDSDGRASLSIAPYLRHMPMDGTPVITHGCACLMQLVDSEDITRRVDARRRYLSSLTLNFVEKLG